MVKKHLFNRLQIKVRPKGLHSFAFYILIFDFPSHLPLMPLSAITYVHKRHLYSCRETFTDVMSALQIRLFMQNKAKFRKVKLNVNKVLTKDYEKKTLGERGKKQSQTNPNKAKFKKAKMNVTSIITMGYVNKSPIRAPKKQSQTSKRQKPIQTYLPKGIMKKTALSGPVKTNPNKPKQTQFQTKCDVDMIDYAIFTLAWLTEDGDVEWNPDCDISAPFDNSINTLDLAV